MSLLVLLDLWVDFGTVEHGCLLERLSELEMTVLAGQWSVLHRVPLAPLAFVVKQMKGW